MPSKATTKKVAKKATSKATKKVAKKVVKKATKKVVKKAAKKTTAKPTSKKKVKSVKALVCAPDDKCFWTTDGQVLQNLEELKLAFGSMDDEVFLHHVNKEKNDFADWVEQVLGDPECAAALRKSKKPVTAQSVVIRCLRYYSS